MQISLPNFKGRCLHSSDAFELSPGLTEVIVFGGCPLWPINPTTDKDHPRIASTTVLQFGKFSNGDCSYLNDWVILIELSIELKWVVKEISVTGENLQAPHLQALPVHTDFEGKKHLSTDSEDGKGLPFRREGESFPDPKGEEGELPRTDLEDTVKSSMEVNLPSDPRGEKGELDSEDTVKSSMEVNLPSDPRGEKGGLDSEDTVKSSMDSEGEDLSRS